MTGQMLYLEEDLHKLLDMARKADIAPPSHAAQGHPAAARADRDARAREGAGRALPERGRLRDRPRALPARVLAGVHRGKVVGADAQGRRRSGRRSPTRRSPEIEVRDGADRRRTRSTPRTSIHASDELRDENSVIFSRRGAARRSRAGAAGDRARRPSCRGARARRKPIARRRSDRRPRRPSARHRRVRRRSRAANERRARSQPAPPRGDESGLLDVKTPPHAWRGLEHATTETRTTTREHRRAHDDHRRAGHGRRLHDGRRERGRRRRDDDRRRAAERPDDATTTTTIARTATLTGERRVDADDDDEGPTLARDFRDAAEAGAAPRSAAAAAARARREDPRARGQRAAQAARVAQDARRVACGRRRTCCRQIVGAQASEPMPVAARAADAARPQPPPHADAAQPDGTAAAVGYAMDASGCRSACRRRRRACIRAAWSPACRRTSSRTRMQQGYPPQTYPPRVPAAAIQPQPVDAARRSTSCQPYGCAAAAADVADRPAPAVRGRRDAVAVQGLGRRVAAGSCSSLAGLSRSRSPRA